METLYQGRPFYSWKSESPDVVTELQAVMARLSESSNLPRHTVRACDILPEIVTRCRRRFHLGRFLLLILVTVICMIILCSVFVIDKSGDLISTNQVETFTKEIEDLVFNVKNEIETRAHHQRENSPRSRTLLQGAYFQTDQVLEQKTWFQEVRPLIHRFRDAMDNSNGAYSEEISYYSTFVDGVAKIWIRSFPDDVSLTYWKSLARYQTDFIADFQLEIQKFHLISAFPNFICQKYPSPQEILLFQQDINYIMHSWESSAPQPERLSQSPCASLPVACAAVKLRKKTMSLRQADKDCNEDTNSTWVQTVQDFSELQRSKTQASKRYFFAVVKKKQNEARNVVVIYPVVLFIQLLLCFVFIRSLRKALLSYDCFIKLLSTRIHQLRSQKRRVKSVMCYMMPPAIANRLSQKVEVNTEFYSSATVLFTDIRGVAFLIAKYSPSDVVSIMDCLFGLLDERIQKYDAYRMDTVRESYVISSGVPRRNNNNHVREIANLALDLVNVFSDLEIIYSPESRVSFRLGFHTGPCVAALFGPSKPRYRLIGGTVDIASRMESTSLPNRIQISSASQSLLPAEDYVIRPRGMIEVEGKRKLSTYWLLGRVVEDRSCDHSTTKLSRQSMNGSRISIEVKSTRTSIEEKRTSRCTFYRPSIRHLGRISVVDDIETLHVDNKSASSQIFRFTEGIHY